MRPPLDPPRSTATRLLGGVAVVGANLLPLVGVLAWGWDLSSLLVAYWAEAFSTVVLAALKALFAERGSPGIPGEIEPLHELREKRGGWRFRSGWPPLYPRNVPFALSILGFWVVTVLPLSVFYWFAADLRFVLAPDLALAIGALVVAQVSDFAFEYIRRGEYAEVSAQELVRTPTNCRSSCSRSACSRGQTAARAAWRSSRSSSSRRQRSRRTGTT